MCVAPAKRNGATAPSGLAAMRRLLGSLWSLSSDMFARHVTVPGYHAVGR